MSGRLRYGAPDSLADEMSTLRHRDGRRTAPRAVCWPPCARPRRPSPRSSPLALFVVWATSQAGYPVTHWAPGGLIVLALLGITLGVVGLDVRAVPLPVKIAVGALAGYTALQLRLDPLGRGAGGRLGRGEPDAAVPARVRAVRALAPAGAQRGVAAGGVDAGDDRPGGVRRAARGRSRRQSRASGGPAPRRSPRLPVGLRQRERRAVADGVLAGAAAGARARACTGACAGCSPAARCCWRRSRCSA